MQDLVRARTAHRPERDAAAWDLDDPHVAVWQSIRHLFPRHACATQTDYGCMLVSWTLRDGKVASTQWAAPIIIRMQQGLLLALWTCEAEDRIAIAALQAEAVREALYDYNPHSRVPTCGVIVLGDG
jgi:hypothetical protein